MASALLRVRVGIIGGAAAAAATSAMAFAEAQNSASGSSSSAGQDQAAVAEEQRERCQRYKEAAFKDRKVSFLMKMMSVYGCPVQQHKFVKCRPCDAKAGGGLFVKDDGGCDVTLCQDKLKDEYHATVVVRHELIHALDHCKYDLNWRDPKQVACSEIRANSLSGDCDWYTEFMRNAINFPLILKSAHQPKCVRRRAVLSVEMACGISKQEAGDAVDSVWESCYKDTSPFGVIP
mmetsp:Transcript_9379/g.17111  ORF Transcript_9379/g.17111 Transcript_9379/m.17111 type:complete len:234 (+) Transcript_9379:2-703(+)